MAGAGDYLFYKNVYSNKSVDLNILTGTASYADVIAPKSSKHTVYIQRIVLSITTHVAGDVYLFDDDGSGPPIASHTDAAAGAGVLSEVEWDFGPQGVALTEGANLDVSHSTTGVAKVHIEAYERLTGLRSYLDGASLQ